MTGLRPGSRSRRFGDAAPDKATPPPRLVGRVRARLRRRGDPDDARGHDDARGVRARREARRPRHDARLRARLRDQRAGLARPDQLRTGLAIVGGSRPATSQPAAAAASGTPTTARARYRTGTELR